MAQAPIPPQSDILQAVERQLLHFLAKTIPELDRMMRNARHVAREEAVVYVNTENKDSQGRSKTWQARTASLKAALDALKNDPLVSEEMIAAAGGDSQVVLIENK